MRDTGVLQAPGTPPPLPQRPRPVPAPPWQAAGDGQAYRQRPAEGYKPLPTVADLAEQVTQAMPAVRPAARTPADPQYPEFRLARVPAEAAVAAMPKLTYPPPLCPLAAYDGVMQVVSALTGTTAEPDVWHRPAVEVRVTSDEEIAAWQRHRNADMMRRLAAAQRAVAGGRS